MSKEASFEKTNSSEESELKIDLQELGLEKHGDCLDGTERTEINKEIADTLLPTENLQKCNIPEFQNEENVQLLKENNGSDESNLIPSFSIKTSESEIIIPKNASYDLNFSLTSQIKLQSNKKKRELTAQSATNTETGINRRDDITINEPLVLQCNVCSKKFYGRTAFNKHTNYYRGNRYKCSLYQTLNRTEKYVDGQLLPGNSVTLPHGHFVAEPPSNFLSTCPSKPIMESPTNTVAKPAANSVAEPPVISVAEPPVISVAEPLLYSVAEPPANSVVPIFPKKISLSDSDIILSDTSYDFNIPLTNQIILQSNKTKYEISAQSDKHIEKGTRRREHITNSSPPKLMCLVCCRNFYSNIAFREHTVSSGEYLYNCSVYHTMLKTEKFIDGQLHLDNSIVERSDIQSVPVKFTDNSVGELPSTSFEKCPRNRVTESLDNTLAESSDKQTLCPPLQKQDLLFEGEKFLVPDDQILDDQDCVIIGEVKKTVGTSRQIIERVNKYRPEIPLTNKGSPSLQYALLTHTPTDKNEELESLNTIKIVESKEKKYQCCYCEKKLRSKSAYRSHMHKVHEINL